MDLDAIKSRLNQLQNTQTNAFWKPQLGKISNQDSTLQV